MKDFDIRTPPSFCQYAKGPCDQSFTEIGTNRLFFMYPSQPAEIASTIEAGLDKAHLFRKKHPCIGWRDLQTSGKVIFCTICRSIRSSEFALADITTLNFNVMFEMGFTLGLRLPVGPVRDKTFERDAEKLKALGLFDTWGYDSFENSDDLVKLMSGQAPDLPLSIDALNARPKAAPSLFLVKSPHDTDHSVHLAAALARSAFQINVFDVRETPRLSVQDAAKSVMSTYGTVAHLIDPSRSGSQVHNARGAFVAGLAMAAGKPVLMIQDGHVEQPIDYRDIVIPCDSAHQIRTVVQGFVRRAMERHETQTPGEGKRPKELLALVDLGEPAAENEVEELKGYFLKTSQYAEIERGRTRLVVGRKGSGKTAIALRLKNSLWKSSDMVVDIRPEGHQLVELKDIVLQHLGAGMQEHTLTAFWGYLLTLELAYSSVESETLKRSLSNHDFERLKTLYEEHASLDEPDFPSRLLRLVERISSRFQTNGRTGIGDSAVTEFIYGADIGPLSESVALAVSKKKSVWLLIDNLDKGWTTRGATTEDILIVRTLLAAMSKLQKT